ncbi:unnamed protein product [Victoria cruziana]
MGHGNLSMKKRSRQFHLLDLASAAIFLAVAVFFLLVFTPFGDSVAASGRRALALSGADSGQRERLVELVSDGQPLPACSADVVHRVPCEDPRRERRCPSPEDTLLCLVPPPRGYRIPISWPDSLSKVWRSNMHRNKIAGAKVYQELVKEDGLSFVFPDEGTLFPGGAMQYVEKLAQYIPINKHELRTALDMGCGVASLGGFLLNKGILTLSFAPRDSEKCQVQFALERGLPAVVAMLGARRLPFPAYAFDLIHCAQCLVPFTTHNGTYFTEADRLLRPGGYFVISGPAVQGDNQDNDWTDLQAVAHALCYELIVVEGNVVIFRKPISDACLPNQNVFGLDLCSESNDPSYAWYTELKNCVSRIPNANEDSAVGSLLEWPLRLRRPPPRAAFMKNGVAVFQADTRRWVRRITYYKSLISKQANPHIRNVMDMNAFFGGFAAALMADPVWVMNVVPARKPSTLGVIYDRGLIGIYHDWCEPFPTYPRTYDFIHVTSIDSLTRDTLTGNYRCNLVDLMVEMDRMLRPEGTVVIRDSADVIEKAAQIAHGIRWTASVHETEPESAGGERLLVATKVLWKLATASL